MPPFHALLVAIRNGLSSFYASGLGFWTITALIALLVPSPIAAPVLYARLARRPPRPVTRDAP